MSKKQFPKIIHVTIEELDNDDPYLQVQEDGVFGAAKAGESVRVAIYQLIDVGNVTAMPRFASKKGKNL